MTTQAKIPMSPSTVSLIFTLAVEMLMVSDHSKTPIDAMLGSYLKFITATVKGADRTRMLHGAEKTILVMMAGDNPEPDEETYNAIMRSLEQFTKEEMKAKGML